jgi:hypothetical protein
MHWSSLQPEMNQNVEQIIEDVKQKKVMPAVSGVFDDGTILETVYRPEDLQTSFVLWRDGRWTYESAFSVGQLRLVPYSPNNNLIKNEVVLLPSEPLGARQK